MSMIDTYLRFVGRISFKHSYRRLVFKIGWLGLYSDMSKVGNMNLPGRQIDKHDEISG